MNFADFLFVGLILYWIFKALRAQNRPPAEDETGELAEAERPLTGLPSPSPRTGRTAAPPVPRGGRTAAPPVPRGGRTAAPPVPRAGRTATPLAPSNWRERLAQVAREWEAEAQGRASEGALPPSPAGPGRAEEVIRRPVPLGDPLAYRREEAAAPREPGSTAWEVTRAPRELAAEAWEDDRAARQAEAASWENAAPAGRRAGGTTPAGPKRGGAGGFPPLRRYGSLQRAVIYAEILGPPPGLSP